MLDLCWHRIGIRCAFCAINNKLRAALLMHRWGVVLAGIIRFVVFDPSPLDIELRLCGATVQPLESHVHGRGALWHHCASSEAMVSVIVSDEGCGWLEMSHFLEGDAQRYGFARVVKKRC